MATGKQSRKFLAVISFALATFVFSEINSVLADHPVPMDGKPLKVFILTGQSNMVGHAKITTLGYIADDPKTLGIYNEICDSDGNPQMVEDAWITYYQSHVPGEPSGESFGQLTSGYGARRNPTKPGDCIGPELTFGIYMQKLLDEPILIIKTAWGGKSLFMDFRPPSAGLFELSEADIDKIKESNGDLEAERRKRKQQNGAYYRLMMDHINHVLKDVKRICPAYDERAGYEIAGFVWFQGWNDMVNRGVYPQRDEKGGYDKYSELLTAFIRDVRRDLKTPDMPFVIGVMGVGGPINNVEKRYQSVHGNFREAMAAPAWLDEFKGNVRTVRTAQFWDMQLDRIVKKRDAYNSLVKRLKNQVKQGKLSTVQMDEELKKIESDALTDEEAAILKHGASNAAYHYLGCGKTMALIGKAFAQAVFELQVK